MTTAVANRTTIRTVAREAGILVGLAGLTTLAAKVAVPLPWTPVPATMQTAAVIFAGAAFGAGRGATSQLLYLLLGLAGAPVFASWTVAGPAAAATSSFGYLLAFPAAAWLAGRWTGSRSRWLGGLAALGIVYGLGALWLAGWAIAVGAEVSAAWVLLAGIVTFLPFDLLKAGLAVFSAGPVRRRSG